MTDESGQTLPVHDRHAARPRARPAGLLRRFTANMHTDTATTAGADADRRLRAGARRAGGVGAADAPVARRAQQLGLRVDRLERLRVAFSIAPRPGATGLRAMLPPALGARAARADTQRRQPGRSRRDGEGRRVRRLRRQRRPLRRPYPYPVDTDGDGVGAAGGLQQRQRRDLSPARRRPCDGLDNDCNGTIDDGNPGGGAACALGRRRVRARPACGVQRRGHDHGVQRHARHAVRRDLRRARQRLRRRSRRGQPRRRRRLHRPASATARGRAYGVQPAARISLRPDRRGAGAEICDGLDNDCDGAIDDGNPGGGGGVQHRPARASARPARRQCQRRRARRASRNIVPSRRDLRRHRQRLRRHDRRAASRRRHAPARTGVGDCARAAGEGLLATDAARPATRPRARPRRGLRRPRQRLRRRDRQRQPRRRRRLRDGPAGRLRRRHHARARAAPLACYQTSRPPPRPATASTTTATARPTRATGGGACTTGLPGVCAAGTRAVRAGDAALHRQRGGPGGLRRPRQRLRRHGRQRQPGGGAPAAPARPGRVRRRDAPLPGGGPRLRRRRGAATELCATGDDEDCDGDTDETPCVYCLPANSVDRRPPRRRRRRRSCRRPRRGTASRPRRLRAAAGPGLRARHGAGDPAAHGRYGHHLVCRDPAGRLLPRVGLAPELQVHRPDPRHRRRQDGEVLDQRGRHGEVPRSRSAGATSRRSPQARPARSSRSGRAASWTTPTRAPSRRRGRAPAANEPQRHRPPSIAMTCWTSSVLARSSICARTFG